MEKKQTDAAKAKAAAAAAAKAKAAKSAAPKSAAPKQTQRSAPAKQEVKKETEARAPEKAEAPSGSKKPARKEDNAEQASRVKGLRAGAIVLWVLAIACEVAAFWLLSKIALNINTITLNDPIMLLFIGAIVLDAVLCIIAAQLWKKANHIHPCLNNSAFVRTLVHQLGVIMALVCLLPIGIVFILKSKDMNKKLRTILIVIMALLFAGTTAASVDYQQPTADEVAALQEAEGTSDDTIVWWTKYGKSFHLYEDCQTMRNPDNIVSGPMGGVDDAGNIVDMGGTSAFENNRFDLCDYCEQRATRESGTTEETLEPAA